MNLQQLQYFKKVSETKNFSAAADELSVTQPALSKAISKLENELGVTLFERNGRTIELSRFGKSFLRHASSALLEIETGINELKIMINKDKDIISIASTYCIGTYFLPFIISNFLSSYPEAKFQFSNESASQILKHIRDKKICLGFYDEVKAISNYPEIESVPIKKENYVLIVPKNHTLSNKTEVSLKDLKNESFIVYCDKDSNNKKLSYAEFINYTPKISIEPNEASMLGGLVAAGAGITIVPNSPLINTNTVSIIKIKEDIGYKTIYMGWLKSLKLSPTTKKFKDYILSLASENN
ncbi:MULTISPECIES: LysR family transcriptional regulator [Clostridium]|uniref:LysR family transcriptional regulator n=1 Tax=Clostridium TaxID=1485 RepID=UPI000825BD21|nr:MULTISPECIES: LysR family transcriptional regulator [Clostridium]PJI08549.1 LysR family transcriptional regulator [Clostridium sp. CT7]